MARATGLKVLEFNMRMDSIEDLPFPVGSILDNDQTDMLIDYMWHDIDATELFYFESIDQIKFRELLTETHGRNFMNHNDTKIGKDTFIMKLEAHDPGCCYTQRDGKRHIVQTKRDSINLADVVLPYIRFDNPEFNRILTWFNTKTITETKGSITGINCTVDGFRYDFGTGGLHGAVDPQVVFSTDDMVIESRDVKSYYPNLAISNGFHPEHLGQTFCTIYKEMYDQRQTYGKGTAENAMLKLALNGTYGDSNNQYSPFYDPMFTMKITINGQLLLCMLVEQLVKIPGLRMLMINTDGLEYIVPREFVPHIDKVCEWWEQMTGLVLESDVYQKLCIRDCNNYSGVFENGKTKRKGAYEYDLGWHQNHSALVVPKAAEAALVHGEDIRTFITSHADMYDFFLRTKVPRSSSLEFGGERVANIIRYYISTDGDILEKVMPPNGPIGEYKRANKLTNAFYQGVMDEIGPGVWDERIHTNNKSLYEERRSGVNTGWTVRLCNNMNLLASSPREDINYEWYIKEAEKLVTPLLHNV
jgi:hypothetical protein